jgi:hypothetical protein
MNNPTLAAIWRKVAQTWQLYAERMQELADEAGRSSHAELVGQFDADAQRFRDNAKTAWAKVAELEGVS